MTHRELVKKVLRDPLHWPAFGFGTGLIPFAPGTWGSLPGILLWWLVPKDIYVQAGVALVVFIVGVWLCGESAKRIGVHDHGGIVWDEILGMFLTLMVIPSLIPMEPAWILAAFLAFRAFDIWKPWPIRDLDHRLHGGLGIMLDDVLAALYAALLLSLLHKLLF